MKTKILAIPEWEEEHLSHLPALARIDITSHREGHATLASNHGYTTTPIRFVRQIFSRGYLEVLFKM